MLKPEEIKSMEIIRLQLEKVLRWTMLIASCVCLSLSLISESLTSTNERIRRIENGLLPHVLVKGRIGRMSLSDRMKHYKVPAVSVAVINKGKIEWERAYGVRQAGTLVPVTTDTRFQAASISKPVTAMAVHWFVEHQRLNLDENVNERLLSWKIPNQQFTTEKKVTIRGLLSHSAGVTVHGFPGYEMGEPVPTLLQVLNGTKPANTPPIEVDIVPGSYMRYSGGGYCILQQLLIDVSKKSFPQLMQEIVLAKVGMRQSTYEQPLPQRLWMRAAVGHRASGEAVKGQWHTYPEMAAAGLWTTPNDLALLILELQRSKSGKLHRVLSKSTVDQMLTEETGRVGLGIFLGGENKSANLNHAGSNEGFRCKMFAYSDLGMGAVIMTNSDNGERLYEEIFRSIATEYAWPSYLPKERVVSATDPTKYKDFEGRYPIDDSLTLRIYRDGNRLMVHPTDQENFEILPSGRDKFFFMDLEAEISFLRDETGEVTELILHQGADYPAKKLK